ncbi:Mpo1-like protein [Shewanella waksmanii]|uniref:Mpo1-like protein n=1 Tax=Shewanella waksmanii TaxID=213783 RepID=UPI0037359E2C
MTKRYKSFEEFYPFYLSQHQDPSCRALHYIGSTLVLLLFFGFIISGNLWLLVAMPVAGYGCAWVGHFVFEKNRPATFTYPGYSLLGDWVMFAQKIKQVLVKK